MEAKATAKYVRMAPRKVRFVMDTIRGKYANDALAQLKFTPNHAAAEIAKVLQSAVANAENNFNLNPDALKVARCYVDGGPTLKRVQPRAQGRAYRILKRTSHITVVVEEADLPPRQKTRAREVEIQQKARQRPPLRAAIATPAATAATPTGAEEAAPAENTTAPVDETITVVGDASEAAPNNAAASNDVTTTGEPA